MVNLANLLSAVRNIDEDDQGYRAAAAVGRTSARANLGNLLDERAGAHQQAEWYQVAETARTRDAIHWESLNPEYVPRNIPHDSEFDVGVTTDFIKPLNEGW
jgi:hypothetical protein